MDNEEEKNVVLSEESSSESNTNQESNTSVERSAANAEESASESEVSVMGNPQEILSPNKVSSIQDRKPNYCCPIKFFSTRKKIRVDSICKSRPFSVTLVSPKIKNNRCAKIVILADSRSMVR